MKFLNFIKLLLLSLLTFGSMSYATNYVPGLHPFELVNPTSTRNIIGNYAIAGNTVMCLTERRSGYGGTCHGQNDYQLQTSNLRVSKYIDIDGDNNENSATWNSTSSYIQLPSTLETTEGNPVLWAGLFWQGRFSTDTDERMRYGIENGTTYNLIEMGEDAKNYDEGDHIDVSTLGANKIKLKINAGSYNDAQADTIYTYGSSNGVTYAAYSDVTKIVQNANLTSGKQTFTVANLTTNEGRERSPGVFGGWSIVVIYKENELGDARNISIYHGFESIGRNNSPIQISGFKLPKTGDVSAQLSVFSGEGEYLYGRRDGSSRTDWMKMSDNAASGYDYLPGATNPNNMFDGVMDGVLRDDVPGHSNNLQVNNDGVDIDRYDVSLLMEDYRDNNPDINDVYIKVYSNNDYITPSMFAFSAELYKPNICYDYTVRNNKYTLPSQNREIKTLGLGQLNINVSIRSLEGDFDLQDTTLALDVHPTSKLSFTDALYSRTGTNVMLPAITPDSSIPKIAFGGNPTLSGGVLGAYETYFSRFEFDFATAGYFDGYFDIELLGYIDFGSGPAPMSLSTKADTLPRCEQSAVYDPEWGVFNIERVNSAGLSNPNEKYPLYTQIVSRAFDFSVVAYDPDNLNTEKAVTDYTVDVELIDADPYDDNNSIFTCLNTDASIIHSNSAFIQFNGSTSRVNMTGTNAMQVNTALKNAAFRMWSLVDENNTVIPYTCAQNDDTCFINTVYEPYLKSLDTNGMCASCPSYVNADRGASGCYACLRDFFGKPTCSRDNFAIRPESYRIAIVDANESTLNTTTKSYLADNRSSNSAVLAAEYAYRFEANATAFNSENIALNYFTDLNSTLFFNDRSTCNDTSDSNLTYEFRNGQVLYDFRNNAPYVLSHSNVGSYLFNIVDTDWTQVDQRTYPFKRYDSDDCRLNASTTSANGEIVSGCNTASNFDATHVDMNVRFEPYEFDLSRIIMSIPNSSGTLYTNNLNTTNILDRSMAVQFNGPLIAKGRSGTQLSNFTESCAAKPVTYDINRTVTQNGNLISENSISSINLESASPTENIRFQRYNNSENVSPALRYSTENNETNSSLAIIVAGVQFKDEDNGSATLNLEYNFERKADQVMNPLVMRFEMQEANATLARSSAHMSTNYIPDGNATVNSAVTFIYGRIAANSQTPYIAAPSETQITIPMYVEGYCDSVLIDCRLYDLNNSSPRDPSDWGINFDHNSSAGDGQIALLADQDAGSSALTINPNSNVDLSNPTNITVDIGNGIARPYSTSIVVTPSVPWLGYNPSNILDPVVDFQGGGGWAGKGNTGLVVETNASYNPNNKRIGW